MAEDDKKAKEKENKTISGLAIGKIVTFPIKLENTLGLEKNHLKNQYEALVYFGNHANINDELEEIIKNTCSLVGINIL